MTSFVAWVDYSPTERERMKQAIALFKEQDTRDELGLGRIRDALADALFPGTSTIQTRLRYFLFVPWIYAELERDGYTSPSNVDRRLKERELSLIEPLKQSRNPRGVFGGVSGPYLQRFPSSVYWNGLKSWQIFCRDWSQETYHRSWQELRARRDAVLVPDDAGIQPDQIFTWHPRLPAPPSKDWRESARFRLTREEATFLQGRMGSGEGKGSLLAHFAHERPDIRQRYCWEATDQLPPKLRTLVDEARALSVVMHGALWLYNLQLCRLSKLEKHEERIKDYEDSFDEWAAEVTPFRAWNTAGLWSLLASLGGPVGETRSDRRFVERWVTLLRNHEPRALRENPGAQSLIRQREFELKGPQRSRFENVRARNRWSGASGTAQIDYRWFRVRVLLRDLYEGLDQTDLEADLDLDVASAYDAPAGDDGDSLEDAVEGEPV